MLENLQKPISILVVRPRVGTGGIRIDTLLSARNISFPDTGVVRSEPAPLYRAGIAADAGSTGKPPANSLKRYRLSRPTGYRLGGALPAIPVGRGFHALRPGRQKGKWNIFTDAPYDRFVTPSTRFWNASGVDLSLNSDGLQLKTQTIASVIAGGIAFANPPDSVNAPFCRSQRFFLPAAVRRSTHYYGTAGRQNFPVGVFSSRCANANRRAGGILQREVASKVTAIDLDFEPSGSRFIQWSPEVHPNWA